MSVSFGELSFSGISTDDILNTFLDMVKTSSPSGAEGPMRDYCIHRLEAMKPLCDDLHWQSDEAGNLIVEVPGEQCAHTDILVFSGHLDVVPPCMNVEPVLFEMVQEDGGRDILIQSDGTTVLGADDKAGLTPILEALKYSLSQKTPRPKLRLIFTVGEETGLFGAKALSDEALNAGFAVTFDHTGRQGTLIHKAPAHYDYKITFGGKSVHAGIMPEQGVNAIVFASRVVRRLPQGKIPLEDSPSFLTANLGKIWGGKGTNVVPDAIEFTGEVRGHQTDAIERQLEAIGKVLETESTLMLGTAYQYEQEVAYLPYELPLAHPGVKSVMAAMRKLGIEPNPITTNGGSDNNIFMARGLSGVVLSAAYVEPHSLKESVKLSDIVTCTQLVLHMMAAFAESPFTVAK